MGKASPLKIRCPPQCREKTNTEKLLPMRVNGMVSCPGKGRNDRTTTTGVRELEAREPFDAVTMKLFQGSLASCRNQSN
jgi:hypothetical protein